MYRFRLVASFGDRPGSQRHSSCGWTQFLDGVYKSQTTTYPLLQNSWANKFLGLGDGRKSSKSSSDADNTFNNTLKFLPSRPSSKKKQEETKRKRTYLKTQHFLPILTYRCASCSTINNLRRPFMGFVFVSNTGRAGLPSRAAFYLEPGCPHQERPEECLEKLSFSLPVPTNKTVPNKTRAQPKVGRRNDRRHERIRIQRRGTRRAGSVRRRICDNFRQVAQASAKRKPKVARRWAESVGSGSGGFGRVRQARRASIAGERSKWQARREHDPTEGQDSGGGGGRGHQLWSASEKSLTVRTVPRQQARRDHSHEGFSAIFRVLFRVESSIFPYLTFAEFPTFRHTSIPSSRSRICSVSDQFLQRIIISELVTFSLKLFHLFQLHWEFLLLDLRAILSVLTKQMM